MGLDEFLSEEKTSSPKEKASNDSSTVDDFIQSSKNDSIDVEGGFTISSPKKEEIDTEVIKVFGGPGTGKTTTIIGNTDIEDYEGIIETMVNKGMTKQIKLLAYTRAAADEAKERLVKLTDISQAEADRRVTTIHSTVMKKNNLGPQDIVEIRYNWDKNDFCNEVGLAFDPRGGDDEEQMMSTPDDEGHLFFKMNSWLKSKMISPSDWQKCPLSTEWKRSGEEFQELCGKWGDFKNRNGLWEFDDAILASVNKGHTLDTTELFIDEVQDLYPLQQEFINNQFGHVERIYLAGDDDQTIYEWAGAKPEYFLDMEGNVHERREELWEDKAGHWTDEGVYILDQSWRMPSEILELAKMTIEQVDNRQEKQIKPHHDGGEFLPLHNPDPKRVIKLINPDDTMVLFRAKYQMNNFGQELIKAGIPYTDRFKTWKDDIVKLRDGLAALKNEKDQMTGGQAERIMAELPYGAFKNGTDPSKWEDKYASRQTVPTDHVLDQVRFDRPQSYGRIARWCDDFEDANYYQGEAIKHNLHQDNEHMVPEGINLRTIHGSKGREADTVVLSTDTTQSVQENMADGSMNDAERRLYYVGMTRTENRLVMCQGLDTDSPEFTLDEIIGKEWREQYEWTNGPVRERHTH